MADLITELSDADMRTELLRPEAEQRPADEDGTDGGDTDDTDGTDGGGDDADGTDADDDTTDS
jgi:hypothetical protein